MKSKSLLKTGKHRVGYLDGIKVLYPNKIDFGCGEVLRLWIARQSTSSVKQMPNGNHGSRHVAFKTPASGDMPIQMKDWVRGGSAVFWGSAPIMHNQIKSID